MCSSATPPSGGVVADCTGKYPAGQYGYGDPSPSSGLSGVDEATRACNDGPPPVDVTTCDKARFISLQAALCIARASAFAEGQFGLEGFIEYNGAVHRVVYIVENTLSHDAGVAGGDLIEIDAITGATLPRVSWESRP